MAAMARPPLLLLLLGLGVAVGSVVDLQKRIIRGQVCGQNERLYHVQLWVFDGTHNFLCGGSLIDRQWILTATHCLDPLANVVGGTITAVLGVHPDPAQGIRVPITEPPVVYNDANGRHDIMLLRLTNAAPARIPTVALPNCQNRLNQGARIQAAGHASSTTLAYNQRDPKGFSDELRCAEFEVVDCQSLRTILQQPHNQNHRHKLYQHWLCGQDPRQPPVVDICHGDSGGGVVDTATNSLYGVISFTGDANFACRTAFGFMDVCAYIGWINRVIGPPPLPPRGSRHGPPPPPPRGSRHGTPPLPPRGSRHGPPPPPPRGSRHGTPPLPPRGSRHGAPPPPPRG